MALSFIYSELFKFKVFRSITQYHFDQLVFFSTFPKLKFSVECENYIPDPRISWALCCPFSVPTMISRNTSQSLPGFLVLYIHIYFWAGELAASAPL